MSDLDPVALTLLFFSGDELAPELVEQRHAESAAPVSATQLSKLRQQALTPEGRAGIHHVPTDERLVFSAEVIWT